jgi:hypothetical protein
VETFVVQIWHPANDSTADGADLRGFVQHVGSGRREAFRGVSALIVFLEVHRQPKQEETELDGRSYLDRGA